jgi:NAD(P)-dependent dehydrogenase (short-subunit alcohol dehydrogenase family)
MSGIIVTGGASGLGAAIARGITEDGGRPIILDRHPASDGTEQITVDLGDRQATERAVRDAAETSGGIDAVVTAAGVDSCGPLGDVPADDWERVVNINLLGTAAVVRAALPHLIESRGRIVTCASTLGLRALPDATAYCASKFGVVGFSRALAAELAGRVGVTLLIPGGMRTSFFDGRPDRYRPAPDAPLNAPGDVAAAVLFALRQPPKCELREMVICPDQESSWP